MSNSTSIESKICTKCGEEKPLSAFRANQSQCALCQNAYNKARYEADRDRIKARNIKYAKDHPERTRAKSARWYVNNKEKARATSKKWEESNPVQIYAMSRLRHGKNRTLKVGGEVCKILWRDAARLLREPCAGCGGAADTLDHLLPTSRGGSHSIGNLLALCKPCNSSKGTRTWMEWRIWKIKRNK